MGVSGWRWRGAAAQADLLLEFKLFLRGNELLHLCESGAVLAGKGISSEGLPELQGRPGKGISPEKALPRRDEAEVVGALPGLSFLEAVCAGQRVVHKPEEVVVLLVRLFHAVDEDRKKGAECWRCGHAREDPLPDLCVR